jgi:hypothetical protein
VTHYDFHQTFTDRIKFALKDGGLNGFEKQMKLV